MSGMSLNKDVFISLCGEPESDKLEAESGKFILFLSADYKMKSGFEGRLLFTFHFSLLIINYGFTMWYRGTAECREVYAV